MSISFQMRRKHLTNTDHLVQEDLRLLITAIINKQKNSDNQRKITKNIIEINDSSKNRNILSKRDLSSDSLEFQVDSIKDIDSSELKAKPKIKISKKNVILSPHHNNKEKTEVKLANKFDVHKDNFLSFVNDFTQTSIFEPIAVTNKSKKLSSRIDDVCPAFTKKGMHIDNNYKFFERYMENKYFSSNEDFIDFKDFLKINFTTLLTDNKQQTTTTGQENKKPQKVRVMYPSLVYDIYYYLCLYEFPDIKLINSKYYDLIRRQINCEEFITDEKILEARRKSLWKYDNDELKKIIKEFESYKPAITRILVY